MGNPALQGVNYCSEFTSGSLSVSGQMFATENPPISYSVSGNIVTVSDSLGVLGTVELTELEEVETHPASPGTPYCGGKPKAILGWDSGEIGTENTPISYSIEPGFIKVDWGGGDIDYLTGTTWNFETVTYRVFSYVNSCRGTCQTYHSVAYPLGESYSWSAGGEVTPICGSVRSLPTVSDGVNTFNLRPARPVTSPTPEACPIDAAETRELPRVKFPGAGSNSNGVMTPIEIETFLEITVITDTLDQSTRDRPVGSSYPVVTLVGFVLSVSDSTGEIFNAEYTVEPIDFTVTCFDYKVDASYACSAQCPSGAVFQCVCPATNSRYCYGFDPDNPDLFHPLFVTVLED
jgi:hypothetical protein